MARKVGQIIARGDRKWLIRVYLGRDEIRRVQGGLGISIMTTPKGVMTGRQARREGVGGEILCEVW